MSVRMFPPGMWAAVVFCVFVAGAALGSEKRDDESLDRSLSEARAALDGGGDGESEEKAVEALSELARNKDKRVSREAKAALARHWREEGDPRKAKSLAREFSDISALKKELGTDGGTAFLKCFLESSLADAASGDTAAALKALAFAESSTKGFDKALALCAYASAMTLLNKPENAKVYLDDASKLCADSLKKLGEISAGEAKADVSAERAAWTELQSEARRLLSEHEGAMLEKEYGASYADYFRMMSAYRMKRYSRALASAEKIIKEAEKSVYGDAAKYHRALCVLNQKGDKKSRDAKIKKAESLLKKFIDENPNGLYRGEAMMELGRIELEERWDDQKASRHYNDALAYFQKQRDAKDAAQLYSVPEKVREVSKPRGKPTSLDEWRRIVFRAPDPKEIITQETAPAWYVSQKEKECIFMTGFFLFIDSKFKEAMDAWKDIKNLDSDMSMLHGKNFPSLFSRLEASCKTGFMVFTPEQKKGLKGKNKLKCFYGELDYFLERFEESRKIFEEILNDPEAGDQERAIACVGIGNYMFMKSTVFDREGKTKLANKYFGRAMELSKKKYPAIHEHALFEYAAYLQSSSSTCDLATRHLEEYLSSYPNGKNADHAKFRLAHARLWEGKTGRAMEILSELERKDPKSAYVIILKRLIEENEKQAKEKEKRRKEKNERKT